ncbi:unnamed protein product [Phytophthora fragariaefolia]|uniref:Unnamed protein product n=1 Tax=Phytophthora fragariaefolia TaxID=1490495 RepID=A0A9W6XYG0_9STRA|nr:unnamed protein product [Phytophthora fragariaefolia]
MARLANHSSDAGHVREVMNTSGDDEWAAAEEGGEVSQRKSVHHQQFLMVVKRDDRCAADDDGRAHDAPVVDALLEDGRVPDEDEHHVECAQQRSPHSVPGHAALREVFIPEQEARAHDEHESGEGEDSREQAHGANALVQEAGALDIKGPRGTAAIKHGITSTARASTSLTAKKVSTGEMKTMALASASTIWEMA